MMGKRYSLEQGNFDDHIMNLIQMCGGSPHADLIKEIIFTALKLVDQPAAREDIKILHAALRELRYAFKLFSGYRHIRKTTVFGSARTTEDDPVYRQSVSFAQKIIQRGFMVITGAGDGVMKGAQEGAGRKMSFGVNIQLPFEQAPNIFIENDPKLVTFKYFFTRKLIFVKETDAIALFPGGYGTLDEMFESLTLMQTGKSEIMPVVLIDAPGGTYWQEWHHYLKKHLVKRGLISGEDLNFFKITDDVD
ncbi:MAG TPA: LOG family protein, partial [Nitrospiria bacterium]